MKKILIIDNGTSYLKDLERLLSSFSVHTVPYNHTQDTALYDLTILSGGHSFSVLDHENLYKNELKTIRTSRKPIIGICLGFELIAYAFGGSLKRMETKENRIISLELLRKNRMFNNISNLEVYENHRWVVEDLGYDLEGLAKSKDGYEVIRHKNRPIYGFQFHPEKCVNRTCGDEIFRNLMQEIDMVS